MKIYRKTAVGRCIVTQDGRAIPTDSVNCDYAEYLRQLASGDAILESDEAPPEQAPQLTTYDLQRVLENAGSAALKSALAKAKADKQAVIP